jgi:hypothetical protein
LEEDFAALAVPEEARVLGTCDGGRRAATVTKASRYLGDQGTCVEFSLDFAAYLAAAGGAPPLPGSLAAALAAYTAPAADPPSDAAAAGGEAAALTTVFFRGFIDTGLPKVLEGFAYMFASPRLASEAKLAASANCHYDQVTWGETKRPLLRFCSWHIRRTGSLF